MIRESWRSPRRSCPSLPVSPHPYCIHRECVEVLFCPTTLKCPWLVQISVPVSYNKVHGFYKFGYAAVLTRTWSEACHTAIVFKKRSLWVPKAAFSCCSCVGWNILHRVNSSWACSLFCLSDHVMLTVCDVLTPYRTSYMSWWGLGSHGTLLDSGYTAAWLQVQLAWGCRESRLHFSLWGNHDT